MAYTSGHTVAVKAPRRKGSSRDSSRRERGSSHRGRPEETHHVYRTPTRRAHGRGEQELVSGSSIGRARTVRRVSALPDVRRRRSGDRRSGSGSGSSSSPSSGSACRHGDPEGARPSLKSGGRRAHDGRAPIAVSAQSTPLRRLVSTREPSNISRSRSLSMREHAPAKANTPLKRSSTVVQSPTTTTTRASSKGTPPTTTRVVERRQAVGSPAAQERRRSSGLFSSLFGSQHAAKAPEKKVECLTCMSDDVPISRSAKLGCGHIMCHGCLRRIFLLSVSDPQHMPPRCCTSDHIPLKHVDRLFSVKFKVQWNRKYQEYTTKNRIYCPARGCGEWIKPANIYVDGSGGPGGGRKFGRCGRCKTRVCVMCNGKWHGRRDCPRDEETNRFVEVARREGWQRCHNCSAMVELKEGCNHMTCRCTAEFCMICGAKWKTCNCPWFNYGQVETDRLNHFNVVEQHRVPVDDAVAAGARGYDDELERRQRQVDEDEALARRLQVLNVEIAENEYGATPGGIFSLGNAHAHHLNENYIPATRDHLHHAHLRAAPQRPLEPQSYRMGQPDWRDPPAARLPEPESEPIMSREPYRLPHPRLAEPAPYQAAEGWRPRPWFLGPRLTEPAPYQAAGEPRPRPQIVDDVTDHARHVPAERLGRRHTRSERPVRSSRRMSILAGLTRSHGQGGGRVGAWLQHVEDGLPMEESRNSHIPVSG